MLKTQLSLLAVWLISSPLILANNQAQVISRIPVMAGSQEIQQVAEELNTQSIDQKKQALALKRYVTDLGLEQTHQPCSDQLQNQLLPELLPRQVNELGIRLKLRHMLDYHDEKPANTLLFHGPPGVGKTEAAAHVAREGGFRFVELPSTGLVNKYQNSGAEKFQETIDEAINHFAKTNEESFIFMDEFDAIGRDLNDSDATMVTNRQTEQAALMHIWQAVLKYKDDRRFIFCFGTNKMKSLHKTFISRFREEHIIEFKLPDAQQREIAFKHYLAVYDFSLVAELQISADEAAKTVAMLVKSSDGMNYRAIRDSVRSFKGQKSLSTLSDEDLIRVAKYIKETDSLEILKVKIKRGVKYGSKIDATIIAIHEELTDKEVGKRASTNKELYDIVQRTKEKDGYDWSERMQKLNEKLSKNVDPWLNRANLYYVVGAGLAYAVYQLGLKPYINPQNNAEIDRLVQQQTQARLMQFGLAGASTAAGLAGALNIANAAVKMQPSEEKKP
jgi:DNA polymerase III delta prime subunit